MLCLLGTKHCLRTECSVDWSWQLGFISQPLCRCLCRCFKKSTLQKDWHCRVHLKKILLLKARAIWGPWGHLGPLGPCGALEAIWGPWGHVGPLGPCGAQLQKDPWKNAWNTCHWLGLPRNKSTLVYCAYKECRYKNVTGFNRRGEAVTCRSFLAFRGFVSHLVLVYCI